MGLQVIGGGSTSYPRTEAAVLVQTKESWSDDWVTDPTLEPGRASWHSGHDLGQFTFSRRFGANVWNVKEGAFEARDPLYIRDWFVRVQLLGAEGLQTIWQGRIASEQREVRQRVQSWVALGPQDQLRKIHTHHAFWWDGSTVLELGVVPNVNLCGAEDMLTGNRSASKRGSSYVYERGTSATTWSHYDYLEYILARFVNASGRPTWTIGGQTSILQNLTTYLRLTGRETAMDLVRRLIPPRYGIDFVIIPNDSGYEIRVFALAAMESTVGGVSLPTNPNLARVNVTQGDGDHEVVECQVEHSSTQQYDHIRVVGERKRTQFSIAGSNMRRLWTSAQETAYKNGTGTPADPAILHDTVRSDEKHQDVFQSVGAIAAFDFNGGEWLPPLLDLTGTEDTGYPDQQVAERRTLSKLLTRSGWDYTGASPSNSGVSGVDADFLPPLAIGKMTISGHDLEGTFFVFDKLNALAQATAVDLRVASIEALDNEWGLRLKMNHNHALAGGLWSPTEDQTTFDPATDGIGWPFLELTIAIETDQRLEVGCDISPQLAAGDGSTLVVPAPGCHYWYLAPDTAVGVDTDGTVLRSHSSGITLRDDSSNMLAMAAGAVARYCYGRSRCRLRKKRLEAWTEMVGKILTVVEENGDIEALGIPITSVEWSFAGTQRSTVVRAGYAS